MRRFAKLLFALRTRRIGERVEGASPAPRLNIAPGVFCGRFPGMRSSSTKFAPHSAVSSLSSPIGLLLRSVTRMHSQANDSYPEQWASLPRRNSMAGHHRRAVAAYLEKNPSSPPAIAVRESRRKIATGRN